MLPGEAETEQHLLQMTFAHLIDSPFYFFFTFDLDLLLHQTNVPCRCLLMEKKGKESAQGAFLQ